jgi:hypothetical protein
MVFSLCKLYQFLNLLKHNYLYRKKKKKKKKKSNTYNPVFLALEPGAFISTLSSTRRHWTDKCRVASFTRSSCSVTKTLLFIHSGTRPLPTLNVYNSVPTEEHYFSTNDERNLTDDIKWFVAVL